MGTTKKSAKVATATTATSSINLDAKMAMFTNNRVSRTTIYQKGLFEGKTEREKKSLRKRLRHCRDNAMQKFLTAQGKDAKMAIAKSWQEYAKGIYQDIFTFWESNTSQDKLEDLANFARGLRECLK